MCAYKYMSQAWRKPSGSFVKEVMRQEVIRWRRDPVIRRIDKPTRLDRARSLGYRAKQGYVVVRVRIRRGGARKSRPVSGRRQRAIGVTKYTRAKSLKDIAQDRVARRFPNLRAINSYWVWADGRNTWFETVLVDPHHPVVRSTV
jgi:large subunit ribosomal protein L15e